MDIAESDKVGFVGNGNNCRDKIDKISPCKNLNKAIGYLNLRARLIFTQLRKAFIKALIF